MKKRLNKIITSLALSVSMVFGILVCASPVEAQAKALTKEEKSAFSKYLTDGMTDMGFDSGNENIMSGVIEFALADVNNDGTKDLIITGPLGLRTMTLTEVYMNVGSKYVTIPYEGSLTGVGKKGIKFRVEDYTMAGAIRYTIDDVYSISAKGKSTQKLEKFVEKTFLDTATGKTYKNGKTTSKTYTVNGKSVAASKYSAALKKYSFSKVKWHELTKKNIKKYLGT